MWKAKFYQIVPQLSSEYPTARWIFLTLTVRNCNISDLRQTLSEMSASWSRLVKRSEFSLVRGWIRTTEVTRGADGTAQHPHFHVLALVAPSYFSHGYVTQSEWVAAWQGSARLEYVPVVDVRVVKNKKKGKKDAPSDVDTALVNAVSETLKYSVKPDSHQDSAWFLELTRQTRGLRFIAAGGVLRGFLSAKNSATGADFVDPDGDTVDTAETSVDGSTLVFDWTPKKRRYKKRM
jgi:plasmid rolling circle replication initiator protein Rep